MSNNFQVKRFSVIMCLQHDAISFLLSYNLMVPFFLGGGGVNNILPHPETFSYSPLRAFHFKFSFPLIARAHQKTWHSPLSIRTPDKSNHSRTNKQKTKDFLHYTLDFPYLNKNHYYGFSLIFIPLHLICRHSELWLEWITVVHWH